MGALDRRRGGNLAQLPRGGDASVGKQRFDGTGFLEPFAALEERELDYEQEHADLAPLLLHQLARAPGGAAGRKQVIDHRHLLAGPDRVHVRLQRALAVLERVLDPIRPVRELPELANRREPDLQAIGESGPKDEATRLDGQDAVESAPAQPLLERAQDSLQGCRVAQYRRDVLEEDPGLGEIVDFADERARFVE